MFSVAPTLGKSKCISVPIILSQLHVINPDFSSISTPIFLNDEICKSMGLAPISQPPWI